MSRLTAPMPPDAAADPQAVPPGAEGGGRDITYRVDPHQLRASQGPDLPPPPEPAAPPTPKPVPVFGEGPNLWQGSIPKDPSAKVIQFRSHDEHPADAAATYLRTLGSTGTIHRVEVRRLDT